jgi:hypothetical protein
LGSLGNNDARRMLPNSRNSMTTRSSPVPVRSAVSTNALCAGDWSAGLTDSTTTMGRGSQLERINVSGHCRRVDTGHLHSLDQEVGVVNSLGTRQDLLPSHHEIVRAAQRWVLGIGHGVEGSNGEREFVENVIVGFVLVLYQSPKPLFILGAAKVAAAMSQRSRWYDRSTRGQTHLKSSVSLNSVPSKFLAPASRNI